MYLPGSTTANNRYRLVGIDEVRVAQQVALIIAAVTKPQSITYRHLNCASHQKYLKSDYAFPLAYFIICSAAGVGPLGRKSSGDPRPSRQQSGGDNKILGEKAHDRLSQTQRNSDLWTRRRARRGRACGRDAGSAAWEPTRPVEFIVPAGTGGGADQMARVIQGIVTKHDLMKQPMVVINKAGGAGGEGFLDVKSAKRQPAQAHHHAVEPVHHAARHRHSVQLEGPDAGRDAGARRVRALGQRRDAVQDREGLHRRGQGRAAGTVQDGRHRLQAGRPDHHRRDREGDRHEVHLHPVSGAAARSRCSSSASTSTRRSTTRSRRSRSGAPASCGRSACSTASSCLQGQGRRRHGVERHPDLQVAGPRHRVPDAARHLHAAGRDARSRSTTTSTCSRRCARRPSGRSS